MSKPKKKKYGEAAFGKSKSAPPPKARAPRTMNKKAKITLLVFAIVAVVAIIAAIVISVIVNVINNERADYAGDLGKYVYISPEDYNGMVIEADVDPVDDMAIESRILRDIFKTRTTEIFYNGKYYSTMPTTASGEKRIPRAGDTVFVNYIGYELGEGGEKKYFDGGNNIGSDASELGLGSGSFIDGFELNLVGKNPDDYGKLTKIEDGVTEAGFAISITYTVISSDELVMESAQAVTKSVVLDRATMDAAYGVGLYEALLGKTAGELKDAETEKSVTVSAKLGSTNLRYTDIKINSIYSLGENPITVEARFPVAYNDTYLAGKTVYFDVYVDKVQFFEVSEIDETYVTKYLGMTTEALSLFGEAGDDLMTCYRKYVEKTLKAEAEASALENLDEGIFAYMIEKAKFKRLPEGDILDYYRSYAYEMETYYEERGSEFGSYNEYALYYLGATDYTVSWETYLRDLCETAVKKKLVFYYIIDEANLRPTEEELAAEINRVKEEILEYILGNVNVKPEDYDSIEDYNADVEEYRKLMIENYGEQYFEDQALYEYSMERVRELVTISYK